MALDEEEWRFIQSFGDDSSSEDDLVTAVDFDGTGDYLAVGDKAGRVCIFETTHRGDEKRSSRLEYKFYTEFQSHEPEFDCLKSVEIEEKINVVRWAKPQRSGIFLLAANDKTVKLWKVHEKKFKKPVSRTVGKPAPAATSSSLSTAATSSSTGAGAVSIPKLAVQQTITTSSLKRTFANAHSYHINSVSVNTDGETFLSADDLRVNIWNMEIPDECFNVVDLKPANLDDLTEVITSAAFHPSHCSILIHSSSRGSVRLSDLRDSAICDQATKLFEVDEDPANKNFYSEIISSVSDARFTPDGRYVFARDYMTVKVWDVHMESRPVAVLNVHDFLVQHLADLYENDCIFDKFECAASPDSTRFLTGSYNNTFNIHNLSDLSTITVEALKDPDPRPRIKGPPPPKRSDQEGHSTKEIPNVNTMDFSKKALHCAWHPTADCVAIAGLNKLYIYQA